MDDVLDEWEIAILKHKMELDQSNDAVVAHPTQKVRFFIESLCLCFNEVVVRHDIAKKIQNVKEQLNVIWEEKDQYNLVMFHPTTYLSPKSPRVLSTSLIDSANVHGRDRDRDILVSKLTPGSQEESGLHILSIVGAGGLGKTTLAQSVYNDDRVKECFDLSIWICVSDPFDVAWVAKGIIEAVVKRNCPDLNQLEMLLQYLRDSISGKKLLLVLDDVWTEDDSQWEPLKTSLKNGGVGSKILVTTRNGGVAKKMGTRDCDIYRLGQLSDEDCWLLLRSVALCGRNEEEFDNFEDTGKKIANKCGGFPLAAKTLGSLLRSKNTLEEWENVLNNEIWQLEEADEKLFPHLRLSYNELSLALRRCFSYCAIFRKDSEILVEDLIGSWMALGYLGSNTGSAGDIELKGREYFNILAMHSLFQDFEFDKDGQITRCKMHDIIHDFAKSLRKNGGVGAVGMKKTTCQVCDPSIVSRVKEYRSLLCGKYEPSPNLCDSLKSLRVLGIRKTTWLIYGSGLETPRMVEKTIPQGMENLIHLRWLDVSCNDLSMGDLKTICNLYKLQTLLLHWCDIREIPSEIGNLIQLRHLDLSSNDDLLELPESICGLRELRTLNVGDCQSFRRLPEGIHRLMNLKHLHTSLKQFPQGLAKLTGLRTLTEFSGGSGWNKLGWLQNLNLLSGSLKLNIRLTNDSEEVLEDAREAKLRAKIHIQELTIWFKDEMDENEESSLVRMNVIDALGPHSKLKELTIRSYKGSKVPSWVSSPLNRLRSIVLAGFKHLSSLPPLGKLPCLEEIVIYKMRGMEFVGREFLGITSIIGRGEDDMMGIQESSSSSVAAAVTNPIAFPKLKKLKFFGCVDWKEWEDITAEEEESPAVSLMPWLTELTIMHCGITALPHLLLRKMESLKKLHIYGSTELEQRYRDKNGSAWKSISQNNPDLQLGSSAGWPLRQVRHLSQAFIK